MHGLGGLGKTTLAEAFAHNYYQRFGYQVMMLRGGKEINEAVILDKLLKKYKKTKPDEDIFEEVKAVIEGNAPINEKLDELIANFLTGRKTIIIFDNTEDIQALAIPHRIESPTLRDFILYLVENAPKTCHLLFTTRYPLSDLKEQVHHINLDKMTYAEQYRNMNLSDILRKIPQADRTDIYKRINGHPRAMEYLEYLIGKKDITEWHNFNASIDTVSEQVFENLLLEKIYHYLTEEEQTLLAQAGVLLSRSPIAALAAMIEKTEADILPILEILRDWSLVYIEDNTIAIHNLTREWLESQTLLPTQTRRILAFKAGQYFQQQPTWADEIVAKDYYEIAEAWEAFAKTSFKIQGHYQIIVLYPQAIDLNQAVLKKNVPPIITAEAANYLGMLNHYKGDYDTALKFLKQSLSIRQEIGDR